MVGGLYLLTFLGGLLCTQTVQGFPQKLGDMDGDGQATVLDLVAIVNHINATPRLSNEMAVFADVNQDGVVNDLDVQMVADGILVVSALPDLPLTPILASA